MEKNAKTWRTLRCTWSCPLFWAKKSLCWVLYKVAVDFLTEIEVIRPKHQTQNLNYQHQSHTFLQFLTCLMHVCDILPCILLCPMTWLNLVENLRFWQSWQCHNSENVTYAGPTLEVTTLLKLLQPFLDHVRWIPTAQDTTAWSCSARNRIYCRSQHWTKISLHKLQDKSRI